jgi:hypothetical protein
MAMTPKAYRKKMEEQLRSEAEHRQRARAARSKTAGDSVESMVPVPATDPVGDLLDPNSSEAVREDALAELGSAIRSDRVIQQALAVLADKGAPVDRRTNAFHLLQAATSGGVASPKHRADVIGTLREVADEDGYPELRALVLGALARLEDAPTMARLAEGLSDPAKALVPPIKALQLLSYDLKAAGYPVIRKLAQTANDPAIRVEALRLLGADAGSRALFESILRDRAQPAELRRVAAAALRAVDPAALQAHARGIVLDDAEDDDVKTASLVALSQFGDTEALTNDADLRKQVKSLTKGERSPEMKKSARQYLDKHGR